MIYTFDEFKIDTNTFEVQRSGKVLRAEPQVLDLLVLLLKNNTRVLSKSEIFENIWANRIVSDSTLSSRIKSVRHLLGDNGRQQKYIRTVHGRGFRFVGNPEIQPNLQTDTLESPSVDSSVPATTVNRYGLPFIPQTKYAKSGNVHIAYQVFGAGPVNLVLALGFVSHVENYWGHPSVARWLTELAGFARVAMFDKRGTGMSDQVPDLPGMDERMDDVRAVMDAAGFERAAIMGISEGGSLAALFAASHPKRCQALILYGSFSRFTSWFPTEESLQELFDYIEFSWGSGISAPKFAPSMAGDASFIDWWGKFERLGATPGAAIALMRMNCKIDLTHVLPSIRVPTLVIHRSGDVLIDLEAGLTLAENIPNADYVELTGTDHIPWVGENASEITATVRKFLSNTPAGSAIGHELATVVVVDTGAVKSTASLNVDIEKRINTIIVGYRGINLKLSDTRFIITFDGPARALYCCREIVSALKLNFKEPRIGMHTGEVDISPESVNGLAVHIATGIADAANPGEVLVSRTVKDLVAGSGVSLIEAAARTVDTMSEDWQLYRIDD